MNKCSFGSDNHSGVHPQILKAIERVNEGYCFGYGEDGYTEGVLRQIEAWLGNDSKMSRKFDAMVRKGMIKGFKKGTSQNSPYYYSKFQIEAAFAAVKCKSLL